MDKKLTRSEIEKIGKNYSLGSVRKATPMNKGWVNYSYDVSTDTGNYIVQIIGDPTAFPLDISNFTSAFYLTSSTPTPLPGAPNQVRVTLAQY